MRGPVVARAPWGFQGMTSTEVNVGATLTAWPCKYDRRITARHRVLVVTLTLASSNTLRENAWEGMTNADKC